MTEDNDKKTELEKHLAFAAERGRTRFKRRNAQLTFDQTRAGLEVISMNVDDVEQELKNQLQLRRDSKGGRKSFWEHWLYYCDLNWDHTVGYDAAGKPIWNEPQDTNLINIADRALRVASEGYGRGHTLVRISKRLGEAFFAHTFGMCLERNTDGRQLKKQISGILMADARDSKSKEDKALWIAAQRGHTPEAWGENQIIQCGNVLWNAIAVGGKVFMHKKLPVSDDYDFGDWTNRDFQMKDTYKPVLRPEVAKRVEDRNADLETMTPLLGPMPEPPLEWSGDNVGPYKDTELYNMVHFVRNMGEDQTKAVKAARRNSMPNVEKAVDIVSRVPYVIDEYVFDAFCWVKEDEQRAAAVNDYPHIEFIKPEITDKNGKVLSSEEIEAMPRRDRADARRELKEIEADNLERLANYERLAQWEASARIHLNPEMNLRGQFWMPHNCDFRGRVYHVGDFGHHNCDAVRALFRFARKKPIGNKQHWLLRNIAALYGVDKVSFEKREAWVKANLEIIDACGRDFTDAETEIVHYDYDDGLNLVEVGLITPWNFWRVADKPHQFLGAAHELAEYGDFVVRNPGRGHEFPSGLSISQDATNSGMQHYAAAAKNYDDGLLTNLVPQPELNDLYLKCLARAKVLLARKLAADRATYDADPITVDEQAEIDAFEAFLDDEDNDYEAQNAYRAEFKETTAGAKRKLQTHIDAVERVLNWDGYTRKVMKRNAMTFAYSSRRHGFAKQIFSDTMQPLARKVRKREIPEHPFGRDNGFLAANILAGIHEQAIRDEVKSADEGMTFLQSCAVALANENKHFQFVSKWGFPMYQDYQGHTKRANRPETWLYNFELMEYDRKNDSLSLRVKNGVVQSRESKQGIAPNTIHTQDALMLQSAVLMCDAQGINDIMVVHDSFSTVLADVDDMRGCLNLALASLYEDYDLYADIREQTIARLDEQRNIDLVLDAPDRSQGKLVLSDIMKSQWAFS